MATANYGDITDGTAGVAAAVMLERGHPNIVIQQFGQMKPLKKGETKVKKFKRYEKLGVATTALTEGVTPSGSVPTTTDYEVTMTQYGDFLSLTDHIADFASDPVLREYSEMLGDQAAETMETLTFGVVKAGTSVIYANGSDRTDVNTPLTIGIQRKAVRTLERQLAKRISSKMSSTAAFNTESVRPAFIGLVHPDMRHIVEGLPGYKDTADYGTGDKMYSGEIGSVADVRYIMSTIFASFPDAGGTAGSMVSTSGTSADVYPVLYLGANAFANVPFKGPHAISPIVFNPGQISDSDPLGLRGHVGWKAYWAAVILNNAWLVRVEASATDL